MRLHSPGAVGPIAAAPVTAAVLPGTEAGAQEWPAPGSRRW
ncbi:hypothetical protein AB0D84_01950 [Streptomyces sp. NPDC048193]